MTQSNRRGLKTRGKRRRHKGSGERSQGFRAIEKQIADAFNAEQDALQKLEE